MAESEETNGRAEISTVDVTSDLEKKIIKQVEFYFGDRNYSKDRFLKEKAEEDDGWVTIECLSTFNRLKALSTDTEVIAAAIRKSDTGLIEVSEDNKKIRRVKSKPLPKDTPEARQEAKERTVYCKGFPEDSTLDQLEEFFADKGKVIWITMRRGWAERRGEFKGSVFVEFSSVDEAKAFLALESLKYNEQELIKMSKDSYFKKKNKDKKGDEKPEKNAEIKEEQKDEEMLESTTEDKEKRERKDDEQQAEEDKNEEKPMKYDSGCVLHFKNVGEQTSREDIKTLFGEVEDIAWVDFARGSTEGFVRFSKEGGAQRVVETLKEKNDGKVVIREVETTVRVLEGEEERDYWIKSRLDREKAKQKRGQRHRGGQGGRGFGGGRGHGRGRGGKRRSFEKPQKKDDENEDETLKRTHTRFDEDEPSPKKIKTEEAED